MLLVGAVRGIAGKPCCIGLLSLLAGCTSAEPPGADQELLHAAVVVESPSAEPLNASSEVSETILGTLDDQVPFKPSGLKLASIAWRTWIYTDTGPKRTRYGYLRAGEVVEARGPAIKNSGCVGEWYRINPRGFVCVGKGATLDLAHPLLEALSIRPKRNDGLPYYYAMSKKTPPHLYFRLPSEAQLKQVEGTDALNRAAIWREYMNRTGQGELVDELGEPPDFLQNGATLEKPYGVKSPLRYAVHAGQSSADSGFALQTLFNWNNRAYGLTTELDIIALDRVNLVRPSQVRGVALEPGEDLPVAFNELRYGTRYVVDEAGAARPGEPLAYRAAVKLTGNEQAGGLLETRDGDFIVKAHARIVSARDSFPSFATGERKWIDISIRQQVLVAYEGRRPVYVALVSTGQGGMADPEKSFATVRGTFMIHHKAVSSTMDGDEDKSDSFNLLDVPFVQYFHKGYALHGAYWHDEFGKFRSHGCINLAPDDAAWLFEWTDPVVPPHWHAALNKERGTVVYIRG